LLSRPDDIPVRLPVHILRQYNRQIQADDCNALPQFAVYIPPHQTMQLSLATAGLMHQQHKMKFSMDQVLQLLVGGIITIEEEDVGR
jgi:hypothetical protein